MSAKLYKINPMLDRHNKSCRNMLMRTCDVLSNLDNKIAGYAVIAWDDRGNASFAAEEGGPLSSPCIGAFVSQKLNKFFGV